MPPGQVSLPIDGRKKQAVLLVPANVDSPVDQKCLVVKRVGDEFQEPQQPSAATEPSPESMSGQESRVVMEKFKFTSRVSNAKMKFFIFFSSMVLRPTGSNAFTLRFGRFQIFWNRQIPIPEPEESVRNPDSSESGFQKRFHNKLILIIFPVL